MISGVEIPLDAHAEAKRWIDGRIADADTHWNALDDLDPVAAGLLGRQQGKARCRRRTDAFAGAGPSLAWKSMGLGRRLLSGLDIGQLGFLRARLSPDVIGRDDVECRCRGGKVLTGLERRHV